MRRTATEGSRADSGLNPSPADWRDTVRAALLLTLIAAVVALTDRSALAQSAGGEDEPLASLETRFPEPALSPEEVVRIQLAALRANGPQDRGIAVCFRFASPQNKRNTGPLPRFSRMIKSGAYRLMLDYREAVFEPLEMRGDLARQRVTLISASGAITYVFYLARQNDESCNGCWMTEAVSVERVDSGAA